MAASLFERTLSTAEMEAVFSDAALLEAMLEFESALAVAEAAEGQIPAAAEQAIVAACRIGGFDVDAIVAAARQSGTIVVPLVAQLKARVAHADPGAAAFVHRGSTSQDAIDTAMVLATRRAMALVAAEIDRLVDALFALARRHAATPMLGRTLLQPARAISFGWKVVAWLGLGCEVAVLCGSLGKIGRDLALLAQAEVGEVAEPSAPGRGSSSAMPH